MSHATLPLLRVQIDGQSRRLLRVATQPLDDRRELIHCLLVGDDPAHAGEGDHVLEAADLDPASGPAGFVQLWNRVQLLGPLNDDAVVSTLTTAGAARFRAAWRAFLDTGASTPAQADETYRDAEYALAERLSEPSTAAVLETLAAAEDEDEAPRDEPPRFDPPDYAPLPADDVDDAALDAYAEAIADLATRAADAEPVDRAIERDLLEFHYGQLPLQRSDEVLKALRRSPALQRRLAQLARQADEVRDMPLSPPVAASPREPAAGYTSQQAFFAGVQHELDQMGKLVLNGATDPEPSLSALRKALSDRRLGAQGFDWDLILNVRTARSLSAIVVRSGSWDESGALDQYLLRTGVPELPDTAISQGVALIESSQALTHVFATRTPAFGLISPTGAITRLALVDEDQDSS